jgi:hypothetical protein
MLAGWIFVAAGFATEGIHHDRVFSAFGEDDRSKPAPTHFAIKLCGVVVAEEVLLPARNLKTEDHKNRLIALWYRRLILLSVVVGGLVGLMTGTATFLAAEIGQLRSSLGRSGQQDQGRTRR